MATQTTTVISSDTILSRSPYLVTESATGLNYVLIEVYVYTGTQTADRPATPTYVLQSSAVNDSATFDLAALANDAIQQPADGTYRTDGAWLDYRVIKYIGDPVIQSVGDYVQLYAVDGYSYFTEGTNFISGRGLLTSSLCQYVPTGARIVLPINKRKAFFAQVIKNDNSQSFVYFNANNQSGQQFTYLAYTDDDISKVRVYNQRFNLFNNGAFVDGTTGITALNGATVSNVENRLKVEQTNDDYAFEVEFEDLTPSTLYSFSLEIVDNLAGAKDIAVKVIHGDGVENTITSGFPNSSTNNRGGWGITSRDSGDGTASMTLQFRFQNGNGVSPLAGTNTLDNFIFVEANQDNYDEILIKRIDECKYEPVKLKFVNRYGAMEDLWFFKRTNETLTSESSNYQNNLVSNSGYNVYDHQNRKFNIKGKEKLQLNSGFVPDSMNETFKQLLLSHKVWTTYETGVDTPVNITKNELSYKTSLNDKLINYTIDLEFAFNEINNVR